MVVNLVVLLLVFGTCTGNVIYHLNDSEYGRMPPVYGLDNYDRCMRDEDSTYCTATVVLFSDTQNELMTLIKDYSAQVHKHYNHSVLERGVCVTKTCEQYIKTLDNDNIIEILGACINGSIWNEYGLQTKLIKHSCVKQNEEHQKDIYDYLFIYIVLGLVLLNIAGTVCDFIIRKQNLEKNNNHGFKLMSFSIAQNWNLLVSSQSNESRLLNLKGLHALRCIAVYLIVVAHVFYIFHTYTGNTHTFEKYYEYVLYNMIFNGLVFVQILFCMSSFLLMYHLLVKNEKREITWKMVPKIIMLRLWRLAPANTLYVFFQATLFRNWGSGPIWKTFVTVSVAGECRRYWWAHLIFVSNYIPDNKLCVLQNWQFSADVQLFILGLCIFMATKTHRRVLVLSSMILVGMIATALHIWWHDLNAFSMMTPETYRSLGSLDFFVRKFTHVNLSGFAIGMLSGHFFYKWQKEKLNFSTYKSILAPLFSFVIAVIPLLFYTGSFFYSYEEKASLTIRIAYGITLVPVMALITSYILFALAFRISDFWSYIAEWDGWVVPSRLSYSVSLIHTFFIISLYGSRTELLHVSSLNIAVYALGIGALSFIFAIPYFLMVEAPFNKLIKTIMSTNEQQLKKVE